MIVYNPASDLYYTIFRLLHFLDRFDHGAIIEVERVRIWDFYFLFPSKISTMKLEKDESY